MFKPGQIWDREFIQGNQVAIILSEADPKKKYKVFVLDGWNGGRYVHWYHVNMLDDIRLGCLVQLA